MGKEGTPVARSVIGEDEASAAASSCLSSAMQVAVCRAREKRREEAVAVVGDQAGCLLPTMKPCSIPKTEPAPFPSLDLKILQNDLMTNLKKHCSLISDLQYPLKDHHQNINSFVDLEFGKWLL